jgi:hypothetical protein
MYIGDWICRSYLPSELGYTYQYEDNGDNGMSIGGIVHGTGKSDRSRWFCIHPQPFQTPRKTPQIDTTNARICPASGSDIRKKQDVLHRLYILFDMGFANETGWKKHMDVLKRLDKKPLPITGNTGDWAYNNVSYLTTTDTAQASILRQMFFGFPDGLSASWPYANLNEMDVAPTQWYTHYYDDSETDESET